MLPLSLSLSLLGGTAQALVPAEGAGIEPGRIQYVHPDVQARLLHSDAWARFAASDGAGWQARFDEATGTPRWLWGRGIAVPADSPDRVATAVRGILERHADLFGLGDGELALRGANYNAAFDTWYVEWDLLRDGLPTFARTVSARVKHGQLVMISAATSPEAELRGGYALSADRAVALAIAGGVAPGAVHTDRSAQRVLLEQLDPTGLHLQRVYEVHTRTAEPPGQWVSFVDGRTGDILGAYNAIRFVTGSVSAEVHPRTTDGSPDVVAPIENAQVDGEFDSDVTAVDGSYTVTDGATYATSFAGDYLTVVNDVGADGLLEASDPDLLWDAASATPAEPNTWVAVHQVRAWAAAIDPTIGIVADPLTATVNINQACNAFYDGNLNFFHATSQCNNTGEIHDVVFHEWGHGFHATSLQAGFLDGSIGEGVGDVVAFLQTDDNLVGPYFFTDGGPVRDVAPDMVYPDDYRNLPLFSHENGLIFGGAMWDLLDLMQTRYGDAQGLDVTSRLLAGLVKGGPDIPGSYYEILVADDDDGDLADGTPNQCDIIDAFDRHGLVGYTLAATHVPLDFVPADEPAEVDVQVVSQLGDCGSAEAGEATLHYRLDGGPWQDLPATLSGTDISGLVPAQPLGTFVEYYVDGADLDGHPFSTPPTGDVAPYSYFSGDAIEVHCDDFEADDGGWTHQLLDGVAEPGADDWEWGTPTGLSGDPTFAASGTHVWGNDLGTDGHYSPDKTNYLTSPPIPTGHFTDVFLQYQRWLQVEDATYDKALILANDEVVWSNLNGRGSDHHIDAQWVSHSVDLQGKGDRTDLVIGFGSTRSGARDGRVDDRRRVRLRARDGRQPARHRRLRRDRRGRADRADVDQPVVRAGDRGGRGAAHRPVPGGPRRRGGGGRPRLAGARERGVGDPRERRRLRGVLRGVRQRRRGVGGLHDRGAQRRLRRAERGRARHDLDGHDGHDDPGHGPDGRPERRRRGRRGQGRLRLRQRAAAGRLAGAAAGAGRRAAPALPAAVARGRQRRAIRFPSGARDPRPHPR
ncbi:MAG: hypothetical protein R3F59_28830 [Myxococcota bacterium]